MTRDGTTKRWLALFIETGERLDGRSRRVKTVPCCCVEPTSGWYTNGCDTRDLFDPTLLLFWGENLCECRLGSDREVPTFGRNILPPSLRSLSSWMRWVSVNYWCLSSKVPRKGASELPTCVSYCPYSVFADLFEITSVPATHEWSALLSGICKWMQWRFLPS